MYPCYGTKRQEIATGKAPFAVAYMLSLFEPPHRYAFIEFRNVDSAAYALNELNGHPFDTNLVNRFTDI